LKKSVQFSELSEVCVFDQLLPSEKWYTGEDHQRFKRQRVEDVVFIRNRGQQVADPTSLECCPVGLEQFLSNRGLIEASSNRRIVIQSVLIEQNRQRTFGFRDPDQIATVSVMLSADSFEGAQKRGKFQEMAKFMD